jgi:uncharacterized membrane protein
MTHIALIALVGVIGFIGIGAAGVPGCWFVLGAQGVVQAILLVHLIVSTRAASRAE